mgnify:CR=1 FL=1
MLLYVPEVLSILYNEALYKYELHKTYWSNINKDKLSIDIVCEHDKKSHSYEDDFWSENRNAAKIKIKNTYLVFSVNPY